MPIPSRIKQAEFESLLQSVVERLSRDVSPSLNTESYLLDSPSGLRLPVQYLREFAARLRGYFVAVLKGVDYGLARENITVEIQEQADGCDHLVVEFSVRQVYVLAPGTFSRAIQDSLPLPTPSRRRKPKSPKPGKDIKNCDEGLDNSL